MILIDEEFQNLIPALTQEEFAQLKENILSEGVRDPLVVWRNGDLTLLDGHNRYGICKENDIHFNIIERDFKNREEAKTWIIKNQFGRRNLSPYERSVLALQLEDIFKKKAKQNQGSRTDISPTLAKSLDTREEIAKLANVSHGSLDKVKVIQEKATEEQRERLQNGEESINRIFKEINNQKSAWYQSSESDDWWTPQALFDLLDTEFGFELDVCASKENHKCERYYSNKEDGLAQEWKGSCWMNPPYGKTIIDWMKKAYESAQNGATVVCLVPARTDTRWWWNYCIFGEVRFLRGRIKFVNASNSAPFPSAIIVFRPEVKKENQRILWWDKWCGKDNI